VRPERGPRGNTLRVATSLRDDHDDLYKNSFLVYNATGTRRKILRSFANGELVLEGVQPVSGDTDWSIEYCENHDTPLRYETAWLDGGLSLFAVIANPVAVVGTPVYVSDTQDAAYGTTKLKPTGAIAAGRDLTGLFLVDNVTRDAFYIEYGLDHHGYIGVLYDRRSCLDTTHDFSVVAGHVASRATMYSTLTRRLATHPSLAPVLSDGNEFEFVVTTTAPLTISAPAAGAESSQAAPGRRITLTVVNSSGATLGEVTWEPAYKLAAWINPAPGHSRSIEFRYDGRAWVEVARTPSDVPN
jgi:hypothetical protein